MCVQGSKSWRLYNGTLYMDKCNAVNFFDANPDKIIAEATARWTGLFGSLHDGPINSLAYANNDNYWPPACSSGGGAPLKECVAAVKEVCPSGTVDCAACLTSHQASLDVCADYGFAQLSAWMCGTTTSSMASPLVEEA